MCSRLRKSVMDCRWFSWHMMFQLGLGLLYVWAQTILYVVFVHAFSNTLNFFFHVFIFLMDTVSYGVEWWKKSDGFPLILLIHDIATSYFWQHHMHIFFLFGVKHHMLIHSPCFLCFNISLVFYAPFGLVTCSADDVRKYLLLLMGRNHLMILFHQDLWGLVYAFISCFDLVQTFLNMRA